MKGLKKTLVSMLVPMQRVFLTKCFFQLSRKSSQDGNSKGKGSGSSNTPAAAGSTSNLSSASGSGSNSNSVASTPPPPPPPNTTKPLPQPAPSNASRHFGLSNSNSSNHTLPTQAVPSSSRSGPSTTISSAPSDRRYSGESASLAPPIVVVGPDGGPSEPAHRAGLHGPERHSLGVDHATPPRATTLNRLRSGPRDTIPVVGKPPRKQRSSRFVVTEKVDIFQLPPFMGASYPTSLFYNVLISIRRNAA
jgi:serine/threonine-protein phosphatase 2A regulatory subunit B'